MPIERPPRPKPPPPPPSPRRSSTLSLSRLPSHFIFFSLRLLIRPLYSLGPPRVGWTRAHGPGRRRAHDRELKRPIRVDPAICDLARPADEARHFLSRRPPLKFVKRGRTRVECPLSRV